MVEKDLLDEDVRYKIGDLQTALLVGCYAQASDIKACKEYIDELEALSNTYGFKVVSKNPCPLRKIRASTYLGKGKLQELFLLAEEKKADVVIFDDEIAPNQQHLLEKFFNRPVLDRTELILEIFSKRARTREAKLQVDLAKNAYQLPRLKRLWTHLSRQVASGKGFLKGEGERQIELDRRIVRDKISRLKKELEEVRLQRKVQRHARHRSNIPMFAIVGYTNVGKSTLLNALTQADILIEDKLFATLDTTVRKFTLTQGQEILLVDTVGFIRKIPHTLIAAFKSTLEETMYTDILLHLIDVNHPMAEKHGVSTLEVLRELGVEGKPMITVLNKSDLLSHKKMIAKFKLKYPRVVAISALKRTGFDELLHMMASAIKELRKIVKLKISQKNYAVLSELMDKGRLIHREFEGNNILVEMEIPAYLESKCHPFMIEEV